MKYVFKIKSKFRPAGDQPNAIENLVNSINNNNRYQTLLGITGSGKTFTIAKVIEELQRPAIILTHNKTLASQLYDEFKSFFPNNAINFFISYYDYYTPEAYVPSSGTYIEKQSSINEHINRLRINATKAVIERPDFIIVASVSALYGLGSPQTYIEMIMELNINDKINITNLKQELIKLQYNRNDFNFEPGTFRVMGDIIDIFPIESDLNAYKLIFFENTLEQIIIFDSLTNKKIDNCHKIYIYPLNHYVTHQNNVKRAINDIEKELISRKEYFLKNKMLVEAQRITERTHNDIVALKHQGSCPGIENYSRHLNNTKEGDPPATLIDYLPDNCLMIIDESHVSLPQIHGMFNGDHKRKSTLVNHGFRLPSALDNRPLKFQEWEAKKLQTIFISATPNKYEKQKSSILVEQLIRPTFILDPLIQIKPTSNQIDDLYSEINNTIKNFNNKVLINVLTKKMAEDMCDYYKDLGIRVKYLHSEIDTLARLQIINELQQDKFDVIIGINLLREGLDLPEVGLVAILDADKEGFLRSKNSLIQLIGRAARNINGKAIFYADKITEAMQLSIDETNRRRNEQIKFNNKYKKSPQSLKKSNQSNLLNETIINNDNKPTKINNYYLISEAKANKIIKQKTKEMNKAVEILDFEKAIKLRDEIKNINWNILKNK